MPVRRLTLILDEPDYRTIEVEILHRKPDAHVIGWANHAGAILAEVCRDLNEYRDPRDRASAGVELALIDEEVA